VKLPNLIAVIALLIAAIPCLAESGYVNVQVEDAHQHPVRLVEIGIEKGASKLTKDDGEAQLPLAQTIKADDWITFQLVHSPPGQNLAIVSPWDNRIPVPSFADKPENLIKIVVVERGDRTALESGTILASLAAKINKANAPKSANPHEQPDPKEALLVVAKQYGLTAEDIDTAIRAWGAKTTDPYEAGLAALYERNYPKATTALQDSLRQREQKLDADQKTVTQDQKNIADAAFFLGQSLYEQGGYSESVQAYQKCLQYRPDDPTVLNNLAMSLAHFGNFIDAESLYGRAIDISERTLGPNDPNLAVQLDNLAVLLQDEGNFADAEKLYRRAIAIDEKSLGPDHPDLVPKLNNLARLLAAERNFAAAEPLYRRALGIDEKTLGPNHPRIAKSLNNLASLLQDEDDFAEAERLYRRAIAIDEEALGPYHPNLAPILNNLAELLHDKHDYSDAEPFYRRALEIDEKTLSPYHPLVAIALNNLASVLQDEGNLAQAEPLFRRALDIDEKVLGPDHPSTVQIRKNLTYLQNRLQQHSNK